MSWSKRTLEIIMRTVRGTGRGTRSGPRNGTGPRGGTKACPVKRGKR